MESTPQWIVLARLLRPQGRKGEILADLLTDFPDRFLKHPQVWLARVGQMEQAALGAAAPKPMEVEGHWLPVGKNAGRVVLKFREIESIEHAEKLAGMEVVVPLAERLPLDADASYISDLLDCTVFDNGNPLGIVQDVQFLTTPDGSRRLEDAAPLLTIESPEGQEILIPFVKAFLLELDIAARAIRMALPSGLVEINQPHGEPSDRV